MLSKLFVANEVRARVLLEDGEGTYALNESRPGKFQ